MINKLAQDLSENFIPIFGKKDQTELFYRKSKNYVRYPILGKKDDVNDAFIKYNFDCYDRNIVPTPEILGFF